MSTEFFSPFSQELHSKPCVKRTQWRIDAGVVLEQGNSAQKYDYFLRLIGAGRTVRKYSSSPDRAHILKSDHFVEAVGNAVGESDVTVRRCIRAMRTDLLLAQAAKPSQRIEKLGIKIIRDYFDAHTHVHPSLLSAHTEHLAKAWAGGSLADFYRALYASTMSRGIGTWAPYEIPLFAEFYLTKQKSGNFLTPFDRQLLHAYAAKTSSASVIEVARISTAVRLDESALEAHRNIVVYGRPVYLPIA